MSLKVKNEELNRLNISEFKGKKKHSVVIVLDNIRSLHNVGSVFRTADAFLIEAIYLCGITACPPHREIQKTALGATETVSWKYFKTTMDAIIELKENNYKICALEQTKKSVFLQDFLFTTKERYAFVFGHEVDGVSEEVIENADFCLEIPQFGTKHSFNISVSTGILLWDYYTKTNPQHTF